MLNIEDIEKSKEYIIEKIEVLNKHQEEKMGVLKYCYKEIATIKNDICFQENMLEYLNNN